MVVSNMYARTPNLGRGIVVQGEVHGEHEDDHHQSRPVVHDPFVLQVPIDDDFRHVHPENRVNSPTAAHLMNEKHNPESMEPKRTT